MKKFEEIMRCQAILMSRRKVGRAILFWFCFYFIISMTQQNIEKVYSYKQIQQKPEKNPTTTALPFMKKLEL